MKQEITNRINELTIKISNVFNEKQNLVALTLKREKLCELLWLLTDDEEII